MLKCTKFDFRWGSAPDPLAGFKAPTSKREGGENGGKGKDGEWREKNEGPTTTKGERRKWIGGKGREGKRKVAGPMSNCFLRPCHLLCPV